MKSIYKNIRVSIALILLCGVTQAMEKLEGEEAPQAAMGKVNLVPPSSLLGKAYAGIGDYNASLGISPNVQPIATVPPAGSLLEQALQGIKAKEEAQPTVPPAGSLLGQALKGIEAKEEAKPVVSPTNSLLGQALQGIKEYNLLNSNIG